MTRNELASEAASCGGVLVTTLLALNFLGDGLRDAWDVKAR